MELSKIQPCLWFNDQAREAMEYYTAIFPNSRIRSIETYPDEGLDEHFEGMRDKVINGEFTLDGVDFVCLDGGPAFQLSEAVSFVVTCADQDEIDYYWHALSHTPEAEQCGWCKDRFGVSWQIVPASLPQLMTTPKQIQTFMAMKKIVIAELEDAGL